MTLNSLYNNAIPESVSYSNVSSTTYGINIVLSAQQPLAEIRYYSAPEEITLPSRCGVWDVDSEAIVSGTDNQTPSWSGAAGSGWVSCAYQGITLDTRSSGYIPAVFWDNGSKGYAQSVTYPITAGTITAPLADKNSIKNAPFSNGAWRFPDTDAGGGFNWFVDVGLGDASTFSVTLASTTGQIDTYDVVSPLNGSGTQQMRVLRPDTPSSLYDPSYLFTLPVEASQATSFGDPLAIIQAAGLQNTLNLTVIELGFPIDPWYGDNPSDASISQESFTLAMVAWVNANLTLPGGSSNYLLSFSKGGLGAAFLLFKHPDVFAAAGCWDSPFCMTGADGTDPVFGGTVGGNPETVFATDENFQANYELSQANLTAWLSASNFGTVNRLWVGGFSAFPDDTTTFEGLLHASGYQSTQTWSQSQTHAWHSEWMTDALQRIVVPNDTTNIVNVTTPIGGTCHYWLTPHPTFDVHGGGFSVANIVHGWTFENPDGSPSTLSLWLDGTVLWDVVMTFRGAPPIVFGGFQPANGDLLTQLADQGWVPL